MAATSTRDAEAQDGALLRAQALAGGVAASTWDRNLARGTWQPLFPGVAATFSGPVPVRTRVWAAVLYAGEGALASHLTAAWLDGLVDEPPGLLSVLVPEHRRVRPQPGLVVQRSRRLAREPGLRRSPPRTRIEDTVLDLVNRATRPEQVVDIVLRACQRRRTTARRLADAAHERQLRWRPLLAELLGEVDDGVASPLERRWRRDVELAHGLPRGRRNRPERQGLGSVYRDVAYTRWGLVIELDGSAAHPPEQAHLDRARDRVLVERGLLTLRYGWPEVVHAPCEAAAQTGRVLRLRGWSGDLRLCGSSCAGAASVRSFATAS